MIPKLLRSEFLRHSALVFGATMVANVLNYVFNFVLSRRLGLEHYATLTALVGILMILSIPSAAINLVAVKYGAEYHALGDTARLRRLSAKVLRITVLIALAIFTGGLYFQTQISDFLKIPNDRAITATFAVVALGIVVPSARGLLQGCQDFRGFAISTSIEAGLKLLFSCVLVYAGFGVGGAMAGWGIGMAIALAYTIYAVRTNSDGAAPNLKLSLRVRSLISTIGNVTAATAILTLMSFMDVVLVKHYFAPRDAGLYAAANLTGKIVLFVVGFLPTVLLPKVIKNAKRGESVGALLRQSVLACITISGVLLVIFAANAKLLIFLLAGDAFIDAAPFVFQYDLGMALLAILTLVVNFRIALHRFDFMLPLGVVLIGEIFTINLYHASLFVVIHVLIVGNVAALAACCIPLSARSRMHINVRPEAA